MKFQLSIDCDNAAFDDDLVNELANCLTNVGAVLRWLNTRPGKLQDGNIRDSNGNTIGRWELVDE